MGWGQASAPVAGSGCPACDWSDQTKGVRENPVEQGAVALFAPRMVAMKDIKRYCDAIAAAFKPRRIILFGSHAYGQPNEDSDVDVLVVMPGKKRSHRDTAVKIRLKVDTDFPVDVLVRGETEVERRVRQKDLFMTHITRDGRVMYESVHA